MDMDLETELLVVLEGESEASVAMCMWTCDQLLLLVCSCD
jgi:hypothetical protein